MFPRREPIPANPATGARARPRVPLVAKLILVVVGMFVAAVSPVVLTLVPGLVGWMETLPLEGQVGVQLALWAIALLAYVGVAWLLMHIVDRRSMSEAGWRLERRAVPMLLLGTFAGAGLVLLTVGVLSPTGLVGRAAAPDGAWWVMAAAAVGRGFLLQGVGEELLWRGYVLQTMRRHPVRALVVSTLAFGLLHLVSLGGQQTWSDHLLYLAMPLGFGFLAGVLALRCRSLWAAIGVHGGFHLGTTLAVMLGWGIDGPAVWVAVGLVYAIAGAAVLARTPRALLAPGNDVSPFDR